MADSLRTCEESADAETVSLIDELAAMECPQVPSAAQGTVSESAFVAVCSPAVLAAAVTTRVRNLGYWTELTSADLSVLRREFGDLVDDVTFVFGAGLLVISTARLRLFGTNCVRRTSALPVAL